MTADGWDRLGLALVLAPIVLMGVLLLGGVMLAMAQEGAWLYFGSLLFTVASMVCGIVILERKWRQ